MGNKELSLGETFQKITNSLNFIKEGRFGTRINEISFEQCSNERESAIGDHYSGKLQKVGVRCARISHDFDFGTTPISHIKWKGHNGNVRPGSVKEIFTFGNEPFSINSNLTFEADGEPSVSCNKTSKPPNSSGGCVILPSKHEHDSHFISCKSKFSHIREESATPKSRGKHHFSREYLECDVVSKEQNKKKRIRNSMEFSNNKEEGNGISGMECKRKMSATEPHSCKHPPQIQANFLKNVFQFELGSPTSEMKGQESEDELEKDPTQNKKNVLENQVPEQSAIHVSDHFSGQKMNKNKKCSKYRGVSWHNKNNRWEAAFWFKKKQIYIGGFENEEDAAKAFDLASLLSKGLDCHTNFDKSIYEDDLARFHGTSLQESLSVLRRKSHSFSRGKSEFRGVSQHKSSSSKVSERSSSSCSSKCSKWEAKIGSFMGNKVVCLGNYETQAQAARQYDRALILDKGLNAITNFPASDYVADFQKKFDNGKYRYLDFPLLFQILGGSRNEFQVAEQDLTNALMDSSYYGFESVKNDFRCFLTSFLPFNARRKGMH